MIPSGAFPSLGIIFDICFMSFDVVCDEFENDV